MATWRIAQKSKTGITITLRKMVAAARKRAHLTQDQLAKRLKTDQKAIWRLEAGQQNATVDMLWRIAAATNSDLRMDFVPRRPAA